MCVSSSLFRFLILSMGMNYSLLPTVSFHMAVSLQQDTVRQSMRSSLPSFPSLGIMKVIAHIQPGSLGSLLIEICWSLIPPKLSANPDTCSSSELAFS